MEYQEGLIRNTVFLTTTELAKRLKMNVQVITRKVHSGEIKAYKIGKDWRIPEEAVFHWLEAQSNQNGAPPPLPKPPRKASVAEALAQPSPEQADNKYFLEYILAKFEPERLYSQAEIDSIIRRHNSDCDVVRKAMIQQKMIESVEGNYRRRIGYSLSD